MGDSISSQAPIPTTYVLSELSDAQIKNLAQKEAKATGQSYADVLSKVETAKASGETSITFNIVTAPPDAPKLTAPNPDNPGQPMPGGVWNRTQEVAALSLIYAVPVFAAQVHETGEILVKVNQLIRQLAGNQMVQGIYASSAMAQDIAQTIKDSAADQAQQYMVDAYAALSGAAISLGQAVAISGTPSKIKDTELPSIDSVKTKAGKAFEAENPGFSAKTEELKTKQKAVEARIANPASRVADDPEMANMEGMDEIDSMDKESLQKEKNILEKRIEDREKIKSDFTSAEITKRTELIGIVANIGNKIVEAAKNMRNAQLTNDKGAVDANKAILEAAKSSLDQLISANSQIFSDAGNTIQGIISFEESAAKGIGQYAA